ncbi:hypothetical protein AGLY_010110 [Aphis glycines]|uniref:Uncharacterized protein n=1 Tax=Aphis glycines TaxID=307491 RepID=A0A6G0TFY7_APHGL|nr:hypothetical protein AGLY_010110 [Aphis glycines]
MQLKMVFPKLIVWHCSNPFGLAVGDVINEVSCINHFKIFMDKLYALYHQSPKNSNELRKIASLLEIQILIRILSVRWVASSKRIVNAVLNSYSAFCKHFSLASMDSTRDSNEKIKYNELGNSMATDPEPKLTKAMVEINYKLFKNVMLHNGKVIQINTAQFYRSLANNLKTRMMTSSSSNVKTLNPKSWPRSNDDEIESIRYGDSNIQNLCQQFRLNEYDIIESFRIFKIDLGQGVVPNNLKPLFKAIATIPISTKTTAALLFINCVGPPLSEFNPQKYVKSWLLKGRHPADDTDSRKREKKIKKIS